MIEFLFFFLLLILALIFYFASKKVEKIPEGKIVYSDVLRVESTLFSKTLGIVGKPDFIIRNGEELAPVEYKSSRPPQKPYKSHILQLAAYCLLVEENFGRRVNKGYIIYGDTKFEIQFTDELRKELAETVKRMREFIRLPLDQVEVPDRNGNKCGSCYMRDSCFGIFS